MINSLNLIPYGNKLHFSSSNISNALDVFRKLRPRKYKYNKYITTIVDVLFLTILLTYNSE